MTPRLRSRKNRPIHMGAYPTEKLQRAEGVLGPVPAFTPLGVTEDAHPLAQATRDHRAMLDAIREGLVNNALAEIPADLTERAQHLKAFAHFNDATMVGICKLAPDHHLAQPLRNADVARLAQDLQTRQVKTLASGVDAIMADLRDSVTAPETDIAGHTHALVLLFAHPRAAKQDEPGAPWITGMEDHRSSLLAAESAAVLSNYIRLLGRPARGHTMTASDVDLNQLAVAAGLALPQDGQLTAPFVGTRFSLAAVTMAMDLACDRPLATAALPRTAPAYATRRFVDGAQPFEKLKRVDSPTTYMDEPRIPRLPKRTDMFSRALFGDMGKKLQDGATGGRYIRKTPTSMAQRRALGAFGLLQDGQAAETQTAIAPQQAAEMVKAVAYFLGADAVGVSRCPDWAWYSHDATGTAIDPPHDQAISLVIDQGFDTMEGASGDDWISVAQSMRAYLRFSLVGGVLARLIRDLGYPAKAHTVMDGDVLQPPLLLLSGLGEVSRIGEVILNPYLGPRLKSGAVTTTLPMTHDKPIDFGLQKFCESCQKCARECPSGAITAGPKLMFNGYEIWKSDSQKCATYRITTEGGAMCGRCMKTCPWNLEGILADSVWRWTAMKLPATAPALAKLDDLLDRGDINPVKKWWWDLEVQDDGGYRPTDKPVNTRGLQKDLKLRAKDQTLAVYPAPLAPHPYPYPDPMDREAGIRAYGAMIPADTHRARVASGDTQGLVPALKPLADSPVLPLTVTRADVLSDGITRYELRDPDGADLPLWQAGAHLDVVIAPEYLRQYSMCGDPSDRSRYVIAVQREDQGRGGSALMHRIFTQGRKIFAARPINHFPLTEDAPFSVLMGGGIGITPMIAMAHRLHQLGRDFALHYSARTAADLAFAAEIAAAPWAAHAVLHVSDQGSRAEFDTILSGHPAGSHAYACGTPAYMEAAMTAAARAGFAEDQCHIEYFAVPEAPPRENHSFTVHLAKTGKDIQVPADRSLSDMLTEAGVPVDVKCADGICRVCACGLVEGDADHRDYVLSQAQRETTLITCQSRAAAAGGHLVLDL